MSYIDDGITAVGVLGHADNHGGMTASAVPANQNFNIAALFKVLITSAMGKPY